MLAAQEDEQGARAPDREVENVRHEQERLLSEARPGEIAGEEPRDPDRDPNTTTLVEEKHPGAVR